MACPEKKHPKHLASRVQHCLTNSGKAPLGSQPGRATTLSKAEEQVLVDYCKLTAQIGYPLKRHELLREVKRVLDHDGRPNPFKNNLPGKDWYSGFRKRHPDIAERTACTLGHQRAIISQPMIDNWFHNLTAFLKKEVPDWERLVGDPRRFFNADESGFPLCVNTGKVLAEKGVRHVYQVSSSNKQQITVMACFNACSDYVPPLIVYPGERYRDIGIDAFPQAIYGLSENGWMDSKLFIAYLKHLDEFIEEKQISRPVILFVDGHSTHMSLEAAEFCHNKQIVLYCLLENATHVLQPCDVGFFGPLKSAWKRHVKEWLTEHLGQSFTKRDFPGVFRKTWEDVTKIENAIHGFQRCGLFPLNPEKVDKSKLHPSAIFQQTTERVQPENTNAESGTGINNSLPESALPATSTQTAGLPEKPSSSATSAVTTQPTETPLAKIIHTDRESQVSESFSLLTVPEIKAKTTARRIRDKLPKAISGTEALKMLKERQATKIAEEEAKKKRKEEREIRKKQKELELEEKRKIREEKKKQKEEANRLKELLKSERRKRAASSSESDSDRDVTFAESDDSCAEELQCPGCGTEDGDNSEWVACTVCPRRWHVSCTGDAILCEIPTDVLCNYPFVCEYCL